MKRKRVWALGGAVALLLALSIAFDSNWLRGPLESVMERRTGRSFEVNGTLDLEMGWPPRILLRQVRFANPEWAEEDYALTVEELEASVALLPLLAGRLVFPEARLHQPVVSIERHPEGGHNWELGRPEEPGRRGPPPVVGRLQVEQGLILFRHSSEETRLDLRLDTVENDGHRRLESRFLAEGRVKGKAAHIEGQGGGVLTLRDRGARFPFHLNFTIGASSGELKGWVQSLGKLQAADVWFRLKGESMAEAIPLLPISLPPTPPFQVRGRLGLLDATWRLRHFDGHFGDSHIAGEGELTETGERRHLRADLVSDRLDLDDLGGIIGAPPQVGPGETASPEQAAEAARARARPTVLPDKRFKVDALQDLDGKFRFMAKSIRGHRLPFEDVELHGTLEGGVLQLQPLNFGVAGGNVVADLRIDIRKDPLTVKSDIQFRRLDLRELFPTSALARSNTGLIGGRTILASRGMTFAELMGSANGTMGFVTTGGRISNLALEFLGLDGAEILRLLFRGDKGVTLRCGVADFEVQDGMMHARNVVIDTSDTNIHVRGKINLNSESLDLVVHPLPKDFSPATLRSPLHVRGTFKKPEVDLDERLAVRGGLAAILGAVAGPLAALLPLIETGPGKNADCGRLITAVQQHAQVEADATASD